MYSEGSQTLSFMSSGLGLEPTIALHSMTRAALTSLLLTPLLLHSAPIKATTQTKKETSRQSRRIMILEGDRFSLLAKKIENSRRCSNPRDNGLRTIDHIPRSSISHTGPPFLSLSDPPPPTQEGDPPPLRGLLATLDLDSNSERDSRVSIRSDNAASWTCTFSIARSNAIAEGGRTGTY